MKMSNEIRIEAPRKKVYAALNDPEILKRAIPGCEKMEWVSDTELIAVAVIKIGPVKAKFKGQVTLSDIDQPNGYTITGKGQGGAAGFAKGGAKVSLIKDGEATILRYEVQADVGGKLAQVGGRLIEGTAKKLAGDFFAAFSKAVVGAQEKPAEAPEAPVAIDAAPSAAGIEAVSLKVLLIGAVLSLVVLYFVISAL